MHPTFARIVICVSLLGSMGVGTTSAQAPADPSPPVFRGSVDLVTIQASVRDTRGRPVTGLTTADFEVRDNGQLRPILSLRSDLQSPVSLAILVDMSGSMRIGSKIAMARQAVDAVLSQVRKGEDEVALFAFDSALHQRHGFTDDPEQLRAAVSDFEPFGTTSLYDATAETARRLADRSAAHKAVIVITDGVDTSSTLTAPEVSGLASSIAVPVYVVAMAPPVDQRSMTEAADGTPRSDAADLRNLAEWTGGQFAFASTSTEAVIATSRLVDQLRQQYVLAIEAASSPEWRRLDVRVKHRAASVKARNGYFGG